MRASLRFPHLLRGLALVGLVAGLLATPHANALSLTLERPSTTWGYTFAGPATTKIVSTVSTTAHLDKQSNFVVTYTNFPDWAKADVQAAIDIWSANFASTVPITVDATWARSSSPGVLGSARPGNYFSNFANTPDPVLWYPSALANAISGTDLDKRNPEIIIQANSAANWDQRNDHAPTTSEYDLTSVFIHELGHGLGFLSTDSYDNFYKYGILEQPTPFDAFTQTPDGRRLSDLPSPSIDLGVALTNTLVWNGPLGVAANGGVKPKLFTPTRYEAGSSVSHLDESTFSSSGLDAVMTPNLDAGEVFQGPGPLAVAMLADLRTKPPIGLSSTIPQAPRNASALVGDRSALVTFDLPANARTAQITSYSITNTTTGESFSATSSPVSISGLKNGVSYSFGITALNMLGASNSVLTNAIVPQPSWKVSPLDATSDGLHLASTQFRGQPAIVYTDKARGDLRVALWNGKSWSKLIVDGRGGTDGRTSHNVAGAVSVCVSGSGTKEVLQIFYTDTVDKDLRHAAYNAAKFSYEIVDGNGATVLAYDAADRVRTAGDVSVSNACAVTAEGLQVFYRDESQGILLGAFKGLNGKWKYEIVDGDTKENNRTTGDVATALRAVTVGSKVSVIYDSVLAINQQHASTSGEVRLATRTGASSAWSYTTLDGPSGAIAVAGYGVSLSKTVSGVIAMWLTSSGVSLSSPTQIRWTNLDQGSVVASISTDGFGAPSLPLTVNNNSLAFGCQTRLCTSSLISTSNKPTLTLVTNASQAERNDSEWITIKKVRYLVTSMNGKLSLVKP